MNSEFAGLRFATLLAPCNRPLYEHVASSCGATTIVECHDWRDLAGDLIDVAFVCSPPLVWLGGAVEAIAAPVLDDPRFGDQPLYCSEVVVHRDSPFHCFDDLRGCRWAVNEPSSWSGYWVGLRRAGDWGFFGEVVRAGYHQAALRLIADQKVDAAAIDCHVLAMEANKSPDLAARVRIIESLGPVPSQPVVVRQGLAPRTKAALTERLLRLDSATLHRHFIKRFAPAPDYREVADFVAGRAPAAS